VSKALRKYEAERGILLVSKVLDSSSSKSGGRVAAAAVITA